jgi:hypothetical protein
MRARSCTLFAHTLMARTHARINTGGCRRYPPPAPLDTSATTLTALKSTSCSIVGLSLGDLRSFGPLSCTYVISFPGPHSELPELPVSSYSPVHRDRHSRPARAPVHAPAHLPSHAASPITHTPARSESAGVRAPRGGCCRFVLRSAGLWWHPHSRGTLLGAMLVCFGVPNAVWRQCDARATAKASDGMLLSPGVPIPGCRVHSRSPRPLRPAFAFHEIGLGLLPTVAGGGGHAADLSSCTRRDLSRRWPVRVAAGASE